MGMKFGSSIKPILGKGADRGLASSLVTPMDAIGARVDNKVNDKFGCLEFTANFETSVLENHSFVIGKAVANRVKSITNDICDRPCD